ncbi:MAG TPA: CoA pyrophosphatase [Thermoanaerobaculia bacterium]|jgi:mutator protein MutT|nr:CoA pyrophosphatase [Thermoanaerobaculia bacterium]
MTTAFGDGLRAVLEGHLSSFPQRSVALGERRAAAVAVVVVSGEVVLGEKGDAAVLLTRRASSLRRHGGQWALPGGRLDPGETPEMAALRELEEEVGLALPPASLLGRLDDYATRSGFVITPVVVWGGDGAAPLRTDPREVAGVYRVPLDDLLDPRNLVLQSIPESDRPVLALAILGTLVYAPTAAVLHQFAEVAVAGRETRVDHYEQPLFAWK